MVKYDEKQLDQLFHALADKTRRDILRRLASAPYTVSELAAPYEMSLAAVSKHLKLLEQAGLLTRTKEGRWYHCQIELAPILLVHEYVQTFWEQRLDKLEDFLHTKLNEEK